MKGNKTYIIKYEVQFTDNSGLFGKEIKIKNCVSEIHAKIELEKYLQRKYPMFKQLIINSCKEDILSNFSNIFSGYDFGDIFKNTKL